MVQTKYLMLAVALFSLLIGAANAFEMVTSTDTIVVRTGETKSIDIGLVSAIDDILIVASPIEHPWMTVPTHIPIVANQSASMKITFSPFNSTEPKIYRFGLVLQSLKTRELSEKNLTIVVHSAQVAIEKVDVSGELEPNGWGQLDMYVKNYEQSPADVVLKANVKGFLNYSERMTLAAGEFRIVKRGFVIPECQASGKYTASSELEFQGIRVFSADNDFTVVEKPVMTISKNETHSWLRTETVVTIRNIGNTNGVAEYSDQIFGSLFFSGDKPTRIDDQYRWAINVDACQTKVIRYYIDYTIIPAVLFVILALWYVFLHLRTIRIKKMILQKAKIEKGMEFTIGIDVKSWVNAQNVEIRDFVPSLFEVRDTPGIKPIRRRTEAGTELIWRFKELRPYEERLVDYKIVPMFGVSGHVDLPRANVSFRYFAHTIVKRSHVTTLGFKMAEKVERANDFVDWLSSVIGKVSKK